MNIDPETAKALAVVMPFALFVFGLWLVDRVGRR
jgi:hypothetical protein